MNNVEGGVNWHTNSTRASLFSHPIPKSLARDRLKRVAQGHCLFIDIFRYSIFEWFTLSTRIQYKCEFYSNKYQLEPNPTKSLLNCLHFILLSVFIPFEDATIWLWNLFNTMWWWWWIERRGGNCSDRRNVTLNHRKTAVTSPVDVKDETFDDDYDDGNLVFGLFHIRSMWQ